MRTVKTTYFKTGALALIMLFGVSANGQTTDNASTSTTTDEAAGEVIKLIDNKGTIKYLQSNNGITTITSTVAGNKTTTTWQLGGTLVDATTITIPDGGEFTIDGEEFYLNNTEVQSGNAAATINQGSGYTLLTRDESTGMVQKMLATDLVKGIRVIKTQSADADSDVEIDVTGLPLLTESTTHAKLFVYRNGIKLRVSTDFTIEENKVTILYDAANLPMYQDDVIEIQYIK